MEHPERPLALTIGDPAGIGPDITLLAWHARRRDLIPPFALLGDPGVLAARAEALGIDVPITEVEEIGLAPARFARALPVLPVPVAGPVVPGRPDRGAAPAVERSIERAVGLVRAGAARAVVTNPIAKSVLYDAGFAFPGHTEYLASLAGAGQAPVQPVMLLASPAVKVVPVTVHVPLKEVAPLLTRGLILSTIEITARDLGRYFGLNRPRLAVSGLNPHAGEDGGLGREEIEIIAPAIEAARTKGLDVTGPHPTDTMFHAAARETYDAAICMYHDQALVPFKTLAFEEGVNVTLGLPFVRTSPNHGTAFALAGTGKASPRSLIEALRLAAAMSDRAEAQA
ncbi:MAG TPA: 4-hydroxythreonine-4-phosphate dehydrogenase PdxA [Methyloceanibacter sp.]|nr:4-hydroxythreonine-4-phosphate dehydrogenase PdxA [Methyloceanibacter sp.]